jgi:hypothetical protein
MKARYEGEAGRSQVCWARRTNGGEVRGEMMRGWRDASVGLISPRSASAYSGSRWRSESRGPGLPIPRVARDPWIAVGRQWPEIGKHMRVALLR